MFKNCSKCKSHKKLKYFHNSKKGYLGKYSICKECRKINYKINKTKIILNYSKKIKCNKCNIIKDTSNFYRNNNSKTGLQSYCKICQKDTIAKSMSKLEN